MSAATDSIQQDIATTRQALARKFELIGDRVQAAKSAASNALDVHHQAARRPWTVVGVSVATGFALGWLTAGDRDRGLSPATSSSVDERSTSQGRSLQRHDLIDTVMVAAGAAVTDLAREFLREAFPSVAIHLDRLWSERGITGTTAAEAIRRPR